MPAPNPHRPIKYGRYEERGTRVDRKLYLERVKTRELEQEKDDDLHSV